VEETIYVYCNFPQKSDQCQKIWYRGAVDTIIRLPHHVGEGPYARVVSMELAEPEYQLPEHHIAARAAEKNNNPVYKLAFDYSFHLSKRDDVINMRVDYTNLLGYWDDLTDTPTRKRSVKDDHLSQSQWREKIQTAKVKHEKLKKRYEPSAEASTTTEMVNIHGADKHFAKRWWGIFVDWLTRLVNSAVS
jgi:hypothetical protein